MLAKFSNCEVWRIQSSQAEASCQNDFLGSAKLPPALASELPAMMSSVFGFHGTD